MPYTTGGYRFTSVPKEGVLRIVTALKNPSPRPGLNPRPLGPVENTLTTTPPRRLTIFISLDQIFLLTFGVKFSCDNVFIFWITFVETVHIMLMTFWVVASCICMSMQTFRRNMLS
jgi:hypothetical protein